MHIKPEEGENGKLGDKSLVRNHEGHLSNQQEQNSQYDRISDMYVIKILCTSLYCKTYADYFNYKQTGVAHQTRTSVAAVQNPPSVLF